MDKKILYFIDFDGTITKQDTLDLLAKRLCPDKYEYWGEQFVKGEFTVFEWLKSFEKELTITKEEYNKVLDEVELDKSFINFIKGKNVVVVSGGFIYNIEYIFKKFGIKNIEYYANRLEFRNNKIKIYYDYFHECCSDQGLCKDQILNMYRKKYETIIYIGDGITDISASKLSDKIYAKKGAYLEKVLTSKKIKHFVFENFYDIK